MEKQKTLNIIIHKGETRKKELFPDIPYKQNPKGDLLLHPIVEAVR
jgi:hypothetical protein